MPSIIHADIFFFVSTIALIIVAAALLIVILYVIFILNDLKHITEKVRKESDEVIEDIRALRTHIRTEGLTMRFLGSFFRNMFKKGKKN